MTYILALVTSLLLSHQNGFPLGDLHIGGYRSVVRIPIAPPGAAGFFILTNDRPAT
jgi:hypothetical protein